MEFRTIRFAGHGPQGEPHEPARLDLPLHDVEIRVLGSLIEKEKLTPDVYPMTLNGLVTACNQKSSREPVVSYNDLTVEQALETLRAKRLVTKITGGDNRVPKYRQQFVDGLLLKPAESAALCILMLRGPQTPGEINQRTQRLYEFASLAEVEETLEALASREPALATVLPRQAGFKEARYAHLLAGEPAVEASPAPHAPTPAPAPREDRIARLEQEIAELRREFSALQHQFAEFRRQFE
jgi:uncharacterized protein YceH (UPF0502 family)